MDSILSKDHQTTVIIVTAVLGLFLIYKLMTGKKANLPPGPPGWPILGNMYDFFTRPSLLGLLDEYQKKYGDIYTIYMGSNPVVVLSSLDKYKKTIVDEQNSYAGRSVPYSMDLLSDGGKNIVFGDFTEIWKMQRKIAVSAIRKYASGQQLEDLIHKSFDKFAALLEKEKNPVNPMYLLTLLIYNIIFSMTCGKIWELEDPEFKEFVDIFDKLNTDLGNGLLADFFPVFKYIPTPGVKLLKKSMRVVLGLTEKFWKDHTQNFDPDNQKDLVDMLIACQHQEQKEGGNAILKQMDDSHYVHLMSDFLFAGTDTSRITMMWVVIYMARNPECQRKLQLEIKTLLGNQPVTLADRPNLHYTNAVLHEAMRMRPVAPTAVPHKTLADCKIDGYHVPRGTEIWTNLDAIHMDETLWKNPRTFDPTRFLDEEGKFAGVPPGFKTFGGGRRVCTGEALAKPMLLMLTAVFFQKFSVSAPEGEEVKDEVAEFTLVNIPKPFELMVTTRA